MNYTLEQIATITGGRLSGADRRVGSVFTDSRSFLPGGDGMFAAIRGANHDGHSYITGLFQRGLRAFLVEREVDFHPYTDVGFVVVENCVEAMQTLAAHYRSQFDGTVVAVTGSNGKTIVKEWIAQLAPPGVKLFRSPRSYNSQVGVPLSVLMMDGDEQVAVFEAGISQKDEMARLERILRPQIGVITNIGDAHQENFASLSQKLTQKLDLFTGAKKIVYTSAHPQIEKELKKRFPSAELIDARPGEKFFAQAADSIWRENGSLAVAVCDALAFDHAETTTRAAELQPVAMRLELREGINNSLIVGDFYNSDINSLAIALDYLQNVSGGRPRTLILSDILQSGMDDERLYRKVASMVASSGVSRVVAIGSRIAGHDLGVSTDYYPTTESYLSAVSTGSIAGRAILIKGNRTAGFEKLAHALQLKTHTTTLEVDLDAMIHNLNVHRAIIGPATRLMVMVKASGYGHGDYEVASMLQTQGVDYLAVAFADEGVILRERGITLPIVVLNADEDSFDLMVSQRLEPEIYSFRSLRSFMETASRHGERDYPVHIKLDVGMHRLGFVEEEVDPLCELLQKDSRLLHIESIFAHLAASDDPAHDDFTKRQISDFDRLSRKISDSLKYNPLRHIANSAAIERLPQARFDMCRLGVGLYGIGAAPSVRLRHVETLRSRIVQIKELQPGESVGYGRQGKITRPSRIATIPVGYADGLDRHLGLGKWSVEIGGHRVPTIGRICMDTCMVDVTGIEASEGDQVVVFGDADGMRIEDMARAMDTIPYEVMTSISARIKRIFIKE